MSFRDLIRKVVVIDDARTHPAPKPRPFVERHVFIQRHYIASAVPVAGAPHPPFHPGSFKPTLLDFQCKLRVSAGLAAAAVAVAEAKGDMVAVVMMIGDLTN
jgi:hypothetical protein